TATTPNPMPVQTADRWSTSRTNSGTMALRTPMAAKPSARFAAAAARYAASFSARPISANARLAGACGPPRPWETSRSTAAAGDPRGGTRRGVAPGKDRQPAEDEARPPNRPGWGAPAGRGPADAAAQDPAGEQAAGPAPLLAGHADKQQGLGADAEHRGAEP